MLTKRPIMELVDVVPAMRERSRASEVRTLYRDLDAARMRVVNSNFSVPEVRDYIKKLTALMITTIDAERQKVSGGARRRTPPN